MTTLLIIGGSPLQRPALTAAKRRGITAIVVDGNPHCDCAADADEFICASTYDEDAITRIAGDTHADGIVAIATDWPMRGVAKAAATHGLTAIDPDTARRCTDKVDMIDTLAAAGVPHPNYAVVTTGNPPQHLPKHLHYPAIVKPADGSGSRGVTLVNDDSELAAALTQAAEAAKGDRLLIQDYQQGPEVSVEAIATPHGIHVLTITDKDTTGAPEFVEIGHSQPSSHPPHIQDAIIDVATHAARALGITTGAIHAELIITPHGPVIIEVGARMGGDHITTALVPASTGIDMTDLVISQALGNDITIPTPSPRPAAIRFLPAQPGTITHIDGLDAARRAPGVLDANTLAHIGDTYTALSDSTHRTAYVLATGATTADAATAADAALRHITITYTPHPTEEHHP